MAKDIDAAIELQLDLMRVSASAQGDAVRILRKLERELISEVAASKYTEWRKSRVNAQLKEIRTAITDYYARVGSVTQENISGVAGIAAKATTVAISTTAVLPSAAVLSSLASDSVVQGAILKDWWAKQSADTAFKFGQAVRQGIAGSETNQQIIKRVSQFMSVSKSNAAALVQTATATIANDARMAVYAENEDIIEVYRALATLDTATCEFCAPLDGLSWEKDGTPIGHGYPIPNYPLHPNCRCILTGRVTREEPGGKRATAGGPIAAKTKFSDWLETISKERQNEMLGPGRADLFRSGKITLSDLVSGTGRPLTLAQLEKKYT